MSDAIDYEIYGAEMQFAEVTLDPGEMVLAEAGAMIKRVRTLEEADAAASRIYPVLSRGCQHSSRPSDRRDPMIQSYFSRSLASPTPSERCHLKLPPA